LMAQRLEISCVDYSDVIGDNVCAW
jgi:hypothetical protein